MSTKASYQPDGSPCKYLHDSPVLTSDCDAEIYDTYLRVYLWNKWNKRVLTTLHILHVGEFIFKQSNTRQFFIVGFFSQTLSLSDWLTCLGCVVPKTGCMTIRLTICRQVFNHTFFVDATGNFVISLLINCINCWSIGTELMQEAN